MRYGVERGFQTHCSDIITFPVGSEGRDVLGPQLCKRMQPDQSFQYSLVVKVGWACALELFCAPLAFSSRSRVHVQCDALGGGLLAHSIFKSSTPDRSGEMMAGRSGRGQQWLGKFFKGCGVQAHSYSELPAAMAMECLHDLDHKKCSLHR